MAKKKYFYVPAVIVPSVKIDLLGNVKELSLKGYSDGCCGMMPVFKTKRDAKRYFKGEIFKMERLDEASTSH